ncbi:MAG: DUF2069 domain-containing protein [Dokdonella sp.]
MNALRLGLIAWALLALLQPAWYLFLAPPANGEDWLAVALALPALLLPLLAFRRGPRRMLLWVSIASLFYFAHGIVAAYSEPSARLPALIEVALCVLLIGVLSAIVRHDKAVQKSARLSREGGNPVE